MGGIVVELGLGEWTAQYGTDINLHHPLLAIKERTDSIDGIENTIVTVAGERTAVAVADTISSVPVSLKIVNKRFGKVTKDVGLIDTQQGRNDTTGMVTAGNFFRADKGVVLLQKFIDLFHALYFLGSLFLFLVRWLPVNTKGCKLATLIMLRHHLQHIGVFGIVMQVMDEILDALTEAFTLGL